MGLMNHVIIDSSDGLAASSNLCELPEKVMWLPSIQACFCLILFGCVVAPATAREWKDVTGNYTLEADLVGFDDELVILQRENKELGSCPIDKLSKEDREFLQSKEAQQIHATKIEQLQTWTTIRGLKVVGRVVDFARRDLTLQRRRGRIYVDDTVYQNLPDVYQTMLLKIVEHFESIEMPSKQALETWVRSLRGQPRTYKLEGVIFELENGDEYGVPFFLFSEQDQEVLRPGWEMWLKDVEDHEKRDDHAFRLQSLAASYQQDQQVQRQVAMMNLNMQAIQSGLTSAWEVTLYPASGNPNPPRWVVTMGRNSLEATNQALRQHPGYVSGPVRRISR